MSRQMSCPSCKAMIAVGDSAAVSCPSCGVRVKIKQRSAPPAAPPQSPPVAGVVPAPPPLLTPLPPAAVEQERDNEKYLRRRRREARRDEWEEDRYRRPASTNGLGIVSLVCGIIAAVLTLIPCLWYGAIGFGALGILFGLLALLHSSRGLAIAGVILSLIGLVMPLILISAVVKAVDTADLLEARGRKKGDEAKVVWAAPDETVKQSGVQVKISKVAVGKVALKDVAGEPRRSRETMLGITLELQNESATKKVDYRTWAGEDFATGRDHATLKDNFDNQYKRVGFGLGSLPVGAVDGSASLRHNKPVTDVLVFEVPLETVKHLDLELPAKNYGGEGMIRFRIPVKAVAKGEDKD